MAPTTVEAGNTPDRTITPPLVELQGIVKRYGSIVALNRVDFSIYPNEVIGLVGDNGAGKSTLIRILSGLVQPDDGTIRSQGQTIKIQSSRDSHALGMETIYQDIALVEPMNIVRNIFLGREETNSLGFLRMKSMKEKSMDVLQHTIGIAGIVSPDQIVEELSGGQVQAVAIARAVYFKKNMLLLDEPTSALSIRETEKMLEYIIQLKHEGISSVLVSHNLYHVFQVVDRFVVLSHGKKVRDVPKDETSIEELTKIIVSR